MERKFFELIKYLDVDFFRCADALENDFVSKKAVISWINEWNDIIIKIWKIVYTPEFFEALKEYHKKEFDKLMEGV